MSDNDMSDEEQMSAGDTNPEGGIGPQGVFDVDKIRQLTELMNEFDLHEVNLRQGRQRIQLRRGTAPAPTVVAAPVVPAVAPAVAAAPWRGFMNVPMKFTAKDLPESPAICIKILIKLRPLQRERRHL